MKPRPIRSKSDLLSHLIPAAPTSACARAIREGRAVLLGRFTPVGGFPTFIVRVNSDRDRHWYLGLEIDTAAYEMRSFLYDDVRGDIPWSSWEGTFNTSPMVEGEVPQLCQQMKDMKCRQKLRKSV